LGNGEDGMTEQDIAKLKELRSKILDVLIGNADQSILQSYSYSDPDGSQSTHYRSIKELTDWFRQVDDLITTEEAKLNGGGIRRFSTNRYARGGL
jgi:hypothetical protein